MIIEQTLIVKLTKRNKKHYKEKGFLANFSAIDNKTTERVLSYPWSGANYSERIWNKQKQ